MTSFLDKIRNPSTQARKPYYLKTWGFDPDMRHTGWACLLTLINPGCAAKPVYWNAGIIQATDLKLKREEQVENMIGAINVWSPPQNTVDQGYGRTHLKLPLQHQIMVESQEFYRDSHVDVNDLIHLAQVAGALYARVQGRLDGDASLVVPKKWKQNKQKEGMHARVKLYLQGTGQQSGFSNLEQLLRGNAQHAMDALCMAAWLMSAENKLPVFG